MKRKHIFSICFLAATLTSCEAFWNALKEDSTQEDHDKEPYIDVYDKDDETPKEDEHEEEQHTPEEIYVTSLSLTAPTKLEYEEGDELDLTGLKVKAIYSDGHEETVSSEDYEVSSVDMNKLGNQTVTISYSNRSANFTIFIDKKYDEIADDYEREDKGDLSLLNDFFDNDYINYTSVSESFFNELGAKDYYRHYQKNCIQEKTSLFTNEAYYVYPKLSDYNAILNEGYLNYRSNYYSFALEGDDIDMRLIAALEKNNLSLVAENKLYQDDMFTIDDLNAEYFTSHNFYKTNEAKFESKDTTACNDFINLCAPKVINEGHYMTFSKVTIELNPFRIRLYASPTQSGKLINRNKDQENKPNWYMLFAEVYIKDIDATEFVPASAILNS